MKNRRLIDQGLDTKNSLEDQFLKNYDDTGEKEILEESCDVSLNGKEDDTGPGSIYSSDTKNYLQIKPVSQMTVMNDSVRRFVMPDGSAIPDDLEPHHVDFVLWLPVGYVGYCFSSLALAICLICL